MSHNVNMDRSQRNSTSIDSLESRKELRVCLTWLYYIAKLKGAQEPMRKRTGKTKHEGQTAAFRPVHGSVAYHKKLQLRSDRQYAGKSHGMQQPKQMGTLRQDGSTSSSEVSVYRKKLRD